jgi:hypothetical protein
MNKKTILTVITLTMMMGVTGAKAQVIIGATDNPQDFSILEIVSDGNSGFRLPQMTTSQRNAMVLTTGFDTVAITKAPGLQIFNTDTECINTWNGTKWIEECSEYVTIPALTSPNMYIPSVSFMKYNLGADPTLNTPKKQMGYMVTRAKNSLDANVLGDLYQWGRVADGHEKRNSVRYSTDSDAGSSLPTNNDGSNGTNLDANGQIKVVNYGKGKFIKSQNSPNDWRSTQQDNLWGNGKGLSVDGEDNDGGVLYTDGKYYQNTGWAISGNNPCPYGARVPTQDEWERLCGYDFNPGTAGGSLPSITDAGISNGHGLIWVPVLCTYHATDETKRKCVPKTSDWTGSNYFGYAIYRESVWTSAGADYKNGTLSLHGVDAPEPLLFLPGAGSRIAGTGMLNTTTGNYHSSTITGNRSFPLYFTGSRVDPNDSSEDTGRAVGRSIRCVER